MGFFNKMFGGNEAAAKADSPKKNDFIDAVALQLRGEVEPALSVYLQILKEYPNDYLAPFFISAIMAGQGQTSEAAANLRSLSQQIAGQGGTISQSIYQRLVVQMNEALHLSVPAVAGIIAAFGDLLKRHQFLQESAVCLEIAKALDPENVELLYKFGDTLHDLRDYDYAEAVLQEALQHAPEHWGALYTYGVLLQDLGRLDEAISCYERAVAIDPDHARCQNNFGAALLTLGRVDEALAHCTRAAELAPEFALARNNLGNIHLRQGEYEAARSCYREALARDEKFAPAYFGLGSAEQKLGSDSGRVEELYRKAIELSPTVPIFQQALDNLLASAGKDKAI
ncbi:MAG: tetratricopeptide repeat protein [Desulfuromonadales bacterium]|nr:tetratricopeptide repeat protein [Desulfuromonadales bacterium]